MKKHEDSDKNSPQKAPKSPHIALISRRSPPPPDKYFADLKMNTQWFRDRLKEKKISQRGLAKLMGIDPAAASLMLRDMRKMTSQEALQISQILEVNMTEVMRQAGIEVVDDVRRVPISSFMDEDGNVSRMAARTHDTVIGPADCPLGTYAIQVRCPANVKDGWLLFVNPTQGPSSDYIDKLCSTATSDGKQLVGVVRRGYRRDTHNLILWPSNNVASDVTLVWSSTILWIKP
jgi:transcriptional regulator with XRE-family HTH domain